MHTIIMAGLFSLLASRAIASQVQVDLQAELRRCEDFDIRAQRALIESAIFAAVQSTRPYNQQNLKDPPTAAELAEVQYLGFQVMPDGGFCGTLDGTPEEQEKIRRAEREALDAAQELTDVGLLLLSTNDFGLSNLKGLSLADYPITDRGIWYLAHSSTIANSLEYLDIYGTQITDEAINQIVRPDTALRHLKCLSIMANACVTPAGALRFARSNSGLKQLEVLELDELTDQCLWEYVHSDTLGSLQTLSLETNRKLTIHGLKYLASRDSRLSSIRYLDLGYPFSCDELLGAFSFPDCGLQQLELLGIEGERITDVGLQELASPDSGMKSLKRVRYIGFSATPARLKFIEAHWPKSKEPYQFPEYPLMRFAPIRGHGPKPVLNQK